jgi:hypothetical protein
MNDPAAPTLFSVGYEKLKNPDALAELVLRLNVTLIDVRSRPWGHVRKGFSRTDLAALFDRKVSLSYEWHGQRLGGFEKERPRWPEGLAEIAARHRAGERLMLMCQEAAAGDCHRHLLAMELFKQRIDVFHVAVGIPNEPDHIVRAVELDAVLDLDDTYDAIPLAEVLAAAPTGAL